MKLLTKVAAPCDISYTYSDIINSYIFRLSYRGLRVDIAAPWEDVYYLYKYRLCSTLNIQVENARDKLLKVTSNQCIK